MSLLGTFYHLLSKGPVHVTLLDPDKQVPERAAVMAMDAQKGGSDVILVGGTTGVDRKKQEETLEAVRNAIDLPVVIFPTSADILSSNADAIFYMSLLNSRNLRYVVGEIVRSSMELSEMDIEVIPVGYLVFQPGMLVGKVGEVDLIGREDHHLGKSYAKAVELLGMELCYLEGGSGVESPIPDGMISAIRSSIDIPLIVGGGINSPERAASAVSAGADILVTGTMVEGSGDIPSSVSDMVGAMKDAWRERQV
jgi:phosphoglycerol geranylgeranyltransferase